MEMNDHHKLNDFNFWIGKGSRIYNLMLHQQPEQLKSNDWETKHNNMNEQLKTKTCNKWLNLRDADALDIDSL